MDPTYVVNNCVKYSTQFSTALDLSAYEDQRQTPNPAVTSRIPGMAWLSTKVSALQKDLIQADREAKVHRELAMWDRDVAPQLGGMTHKRLVRCGASLCASSLAMGLLRSARRYYSGDSGGGRGGGRRN